MRPDQPHGDAAEYSPHGTAIYRNAPPPEINEEAATVLLALADDEFMMGHRHSEWLGLSPFLEEDLTTASIGQDELGHAGALYALIWPSWELRDADVVRRPSESWRSCPLTEMAGVPWEKSLIRHWLYDLIEPFRWTSATAAFGASVAGLTALAQRVESEEHFHRAHATALVQRLGAVDTARMRLQDALDEVAPAAMALLHELSSIDSQRGAAATEAVREAAQRASLVISHGSGPAMDRRLRDADAEGALRQFVDVVAFDPDASW